MFEGPLPVAATFSKDPKFWGKDFEPKALTYGDGVSVHGTDGKLYLDWISALGANLLGYAVAADGSPQFEWLNRVQLAIAEGVAFSLPHVLERQVAEKFVGLLGSRVPGWTPDGLGVRFGKSGSDACSMAIRLARAATGRTRVLSSGYHGWHDAFVSTTSPAWGVTWPQHVENLEFGKVAGLLRMATDVAAVIIEQPVQDAEPGYWKELRRCCDRFGALLILDEVVTWPRFALGGAAELYGIEPDICCYAKALGNGMPISAIVGRREYFEWFARNDPVFVSSTSFGEAVSLAAVDAVLDLWNQAGVDHLWMIGRTLMKGLQEVGYNVIGHPPRSLLQFRSNAERGYFIAGMRDRGVLINRPNLPNLSHSLADVELTVKGASEVRREIDALGPDGIAARMAGKEPAVLFENR